ncbi:MAG TPA: PqqD family protein [Ktedonobacteraceae bacterium]|nr:PqqD family protein [Ktedonobacteraceae bacterium]
MIIRNSAVLWRELDGEAILLYQQEGCSFNLNPVGTLIWKMLDGQHTPSDMATAICEAYEVEHEQAQHDVEQLLDNLRQYNLLIDSDSTSPSTV